MVFLAFAGARSTLSLRQQKSLKTVKDYQQVLLFVAIVAGIFYGRKISKPATRSWTPLERGEKCLGSLPLSHPSLSPIPSFPIAIAGVQYGAGLLESLVSGSSPPINLFTLLSNEEEKLFNDMNSTHKRTHARIDTENVALDDFSCLYFALFEL